MYHYEYVPAEEWRPVRDELLEIIRKLKQEVQDDFTFQFRFVGSSKQNMITRDPRTNTGYDFDVNLEVHDPDENYTAEEIREIFRRGLDRVTNPYHIPVFGYDHAENSTRVLTIKVKDRKNFCIKHSCDFCIVHNYGKGRQQYIRYNKQQNTFTWADQPKGFRNLPKKIDWVKQHSLWGEVRDLYLYKKNTNPDPNKRSRSLFAETVHEIWNQNQK